MLKGGRRRALGENVDFTAYDTRMGLAARDIVAQNSRALKAVPALTRTV